MMRADPTPRRDALGDAPDGGGRRRMSITVILFAIAFLGSAALIVWGLLGRTAGQVAVIVVGFIVMAITLAAIATAGAIGAYRSGREGEGGRAFLAALLGGIAAVGAWVCLGTAAVLALLYRP